MENPKIKYLNTARSNAILKKHKILLYRQILVQFSDTTFYEIPSSGAWIVSHRPTNKQIDKGIWRR
jgi:hypothetical protein